MPWSLRPTSSSSIRTWKRTRPTHWWSPHVPGAASSSTVSDAAFTRTSASRTVTGPRLSQRGSTRWVATRFRVMLRALGLGRTLEEIIGLVVTRYAVEEQFPAPSDRPGLDWWISFDDHLNWFGGARPLRADLLRVLVSVAEHGRVSIQLQVVESKFRRREELGTAEDQLTRTAALFQAALAPRSDDHDEPNDVEFWRRELLRCSMKLPAGSSMRRICLHSDNSATPTSDCRTRFGTRSRTVTTHLRSRASRAPSQRTCSLPLKGTPRRRAMH